MRGACCQHTLGGLDPLRDALSRRDPFSIASSSIGPPSLILVVKLGFAGLPQGHNEKKAKYIFIQSPKKVHTQTRQLVHAFHMVVYRAETALRELIRDVYPRWREESRTLIRMFLNSTGDIIVADGELRVTFDKQSAPHRTKLLALICNELNSQKAKFPGSDLVLHFEVRGVENVAQSD